MSNELALRQVVASFLRELALWALIVGPFLYFYSGHSAGGPQAAIPHLQIIVLIWLALGCLRLAAWRWLPGTVLPRGVAAILLCGVLAILASYYLLVLVGLWSWGRVVSWELISNYIGQLPSLADSLGLSFGLVAFASVLVFCIALFGVDWIFTRRDWSQGLSGRLSRPLTIALVLGGLAAVAVQAARLLAFPPLSQREPITLTFSPKPDRVANLMSHIVVSPAQVALARQDRDSYQPGTSVHKPNVVLVVVDALRADHMGLYGYSRDTTPYLSALQRSGQLSVARQVVAACPESFCSLLAIARSKPLHLLTGEDVSLHEVLRRHGYRVELILGGDHTHFYGLRQSYGVIDSYFDGSMVRGRNVNDDALVLERANALPPWDGKPVLLQFHLMSVHLLGMRDPGFARFQPARPYVPWRKGAITDFSKPQLEAANYYDNGVLQFDDVLRRLMSSLTARQYMRDTIVVVVGDHGEALGEHGEYGHAKSVFEPAMRVPLVFAGFGRPPPLIADNGSALASQLDIAPTLLQLMGMPMPLSWTGMPLQNKLPPRQLAFQQGYFVGVYDGTQGDHTLKYWRHLNTGEERVYDLDADPAEQRDLLPTLSGTRLEGLRLAVKAVAASVAK